MRSRTESESEILFRNLQRVCERPKPFERYTASELWTDDHVSAEMLKYHLDAEAGLASRNHAFIDRSVTWIAERFQIDSRKRVGDFGCGPGLYTTRLARCGARVTGIDFSNRSIQYAMDSAKSEGLDIRYVHQNYLEFDTDDRFDLIVMIMCDFCVLSPDQRRTLLEHFRALLAPGGSILLDVNSLVAYAQREEYATCQFNLMDGFWSPDPYVGFLNIFKYPGERVVLDKYTVVEKRRIRTVYNWFQHFEPETLRREFDESGLQVDDIFADVAGSGFDPEGLEFAVVATKMEE